MGCITIDNYNLEMTFAPDRIMIPPGTSVFLGIDIEDKHYIVLKEGRWRDHSKLKDGESFVPEIAYELVEYDEKTHVVKAKEVTDESLLERIAVELMNDMISRESINEETDRKNHPYRHR